MRHTRNIIRLALPILAALGGPAPLAAQTSTSDWPCKQVRVPEIALGGVWSGPAIDAERRSWRDDAAVSDLVAHIAPRRTPLEAAEKMIAEFAAAAGDNRKARLTLLFAGLYGLKDLAEKTREETQSFYALQSQKPADPEKVKKAAEALQWRVRLFEEQRKMVTYVCESPALIEQRFGALARAIMNAMQ
jgi:hypothetical protein